MTAMRIIFDYPPLYAEIAAAFALETTQKEARPIFAWSDRIYNPHRWSIIPALIAHETVHGGRQGGDPAGWWKRYIADQSFRLAEEVLAHVAEYRVLATNRDRTGRRIGLVETAKRMASPLYGYEPRLAVQRARLLLQEALKEAA